MRPHTATLLLILFTAWHTLRAQAPATLPTTTVEFSSSSHDFKAIKEGETVTHRFKFINTGSHPLKIESVKASCGCTTPDWTRDEVPPGGRGFVEVKFDSKGKMGIQKKTVTVTMNTEPPTKVLSFQGEVTVDGQPTETVKPPMLPPAQQPAGTQPTNEAPATGGANASTDHVVAPAPPADQKLDLPITTMRWVATTHDFGKIKSGDKVSHKYRFTNTGSAPLKVYSAKPSCGCTTPAYTTKEVPPGKKGFVLVQFDSKGKEGQQKKSVTVTTNTDPMTTILEFEAQVEPKR